MLDWDFILSLRNDDKFRPYFYDQHIISKNEHYEYLTKQLTNKNFNNWIITYNSKDVGYIRILNNDVSIMILKKFHNKSIGTNALRLLENKAKDLGIKKLIGRIMIDNKKSENIFKKNNYKLKIFWYEKSLDDVDV